MTCAIVAGAMALAAWYHGSPSRESDLLEWTSSGSMTSAAGLVIDTRVGDPRHRSDETIVVFDRAEIRWAPRSPAEQPRDGYTALEHGRMIETTVQLPPQPANQRDARRLELVVDVEPVIIERGGSRRFADPWTRLGHVGVVPKATSNQSETEKPDFIELMRFVTGFGGTSTMRQDVTTLAPLLGAETTIRIRLTTGMDPGWRVSVRLHIVEGEAGYRRPVFAEPVFNLERFTARQRRRTTEITIPERLSLPRIRILTSGHGEIQEFMSATHILRIDGREIARWRPWREDGGTQHAENPATRRTNIDGRELWSSDIDRAGWMPASVVRPVTIPVAELTPGERKIEIEILEIVPAEEGGSAGGYWLVSATVIADEPWPTN